MDINLVENSLGLKLPHSYKEAVGKIEGHSSSVSNFITNSDEVICENLSLRNGGYNGMKWPPNYFCFATDGMGSYLYIDANLVSSPVFLADEEEFGTLCEDSLSDWVLVNLGC